MATTVVAATYGVLPEFDPETQSVKSYTARAKVFFTANSIPEAKQPAILLSCIGARTYDLLGSLLAPTALDTADLDTLFQELKDHFQPKPNVISQRFLFHQRNQKPTESISQYLAALRELATDCNFGVKAALEETLRDRIVGGVRSLSLLLAMKDLTFSDAYGTAQAMEAAEANAKAISGTTASVHHVTKQPPRRGKPHLSHKPGSSPPLGEKRQQPCYRCGRSNHQSQDCKFIDSTCHACGKKGHIAPVCRSKQSKPQNQPFRKRSADKVRANYVGVDNPDEWEEELHLFAVGQGTRKQAYSLPAASASLDGVGHRSRSVGAPRGRIQVTVPGQAAE